MRTAPPPSDSNQSPPDPSRRRVRARRAIAGLLALSIGASVVATSVGGTPATAAASNTFSFRDGSTQKTFGPNTTVMIDGVLRYDDHCDSMDQATKDFFYPATDVYVVPTGSAAGKLTDVSGDVPNTIVGLGEGSFLGEIIGFTSPAGNIGTGTFDIVFDTCQDGFLTNGDTVFSQAITVALPETLPPVSPSIAELKERSRLEYIEWLKFHALMTVVFNIDKAKEVAACMLTRTPICLMQVLAVIFDEAHAGNRQGGEITDMAPQLVMNVAKNHGAIWKDPPDPAFDQLPVLERPADGDLATTGQPLPDAFADVLPELADEAALTEALLHAIERYQGAQQAGNGDWALAQARAARDLSTTLADQLGSADALTTFRATIASDAAGISASLDAGVDFSNRVRTSGFTADEVRTLRNQGFTHAEVLEFEAGFVANGSLPRISAQDLLDQIDAVIDARADMAVTLTDSAAGWNAVAVSLQTDKRVMPTAVAGGPYTGGAGSSLTLNGAASVAATGSSLVARDWDLDGDGEFDDASGVNPTFTVDSDQDLLVSLRVTDNAGRQAVDHAVVDVNGGNRAPVIAASSPARATSTVVGQPNTFSVTANDADGDPLVYAWALDGQAVGGNGSSFQWTPTAEQAGTHSLTVTVSDGVTSGTLGVWRVAVNLPDADADGWSAGVDCDDARNDISPGNVERIGNDLDDDCDAGTPDAPPGGLTGALWGWGVSEGVGIGTFNDQPSPVAVPTLPEVVQVASNRASGWAVLPSGEVRAWGQNHRGMLGDGTLNVRRSPVPVVGVGGNGVLSGVIGVDSEIMHTVAVRQDGSVVAWGNNDNGQAGDGSTVGERQAPVQVIRSDGSPLLGAVEVDAGASESYALMGDGSIMSWGNGRCFGQYPHPQSRTAVPATLFGTGVVQIEAGAGLVLARKADGSLWSCGGDTELMDRGKSLTSQQIATPAPMNTFGPGSGVIDMSAGGDGAIALTADGSVWLWGKNTNGTLSPLGVAPFAIVDRPTKVTLPAGAPVVDVEMDSSCNGLAIRADGSVLSWGCNAHGGAGVGSFVDPANGLHVIQLGANAAHAASAAGWNGYVLVRPIADQTVVRPAPWILIDAHDASIDESSGGAVELTLSAPAPTAVQVTWAVEGGSPATVEIPAGATSVSVPVSVGDDQLDEDDEELAFHVLSVSHGVQVERRSAVLTVVDDDGAPSVSVDDVTVTEGATSLTDVVVTVRLSQPSGKDVEVLWSTADGTATSPSDYVAADGHLLVAAGDSTATFHLAVIGDKVVESHEQFGVTLSEPVNAAIGSGTAAVTVTDDEPIVVKSSAPTVTEGDAGTTPVMFNVTITAPPTGTSVSIPWRIAAGTAGIPGDVVDASGQLEFGNGQSFRAVTVEVVGDAVVESTEVFRMVLEQGTASDGRPVVVSEPSVGEILDNDTAPTPEDPEDPQDPEDPEDPEDPQDPEQPEEPETPGFGFKRFYWPVFAKPFVNVSRAGDTIPVNFSLGGNHGVNVLAPGYPTSKQVPCKLSLPIVVPGTLTPTPSGLVYHNHRGWGHYRYNWKTDKAWKGQCREFVMKFTDGTEAKATFHFAKLWG